MDKKLSSDTWEALMRAHAAMMRTFQAAGNWDELPMREYDVLYTLAKSNCSMSQKELLAGVLLSQPALSRLLERMTKQGLIEREADPADARSIRITLTGKGRELQKRVGRTHADTIHTELSSRLSESQLQQLRTLALTLAEGKQND